MPQGIDIPEIKIYAPNSSEQTMSCPTSPEFSYVQQPGVINPDKLSSAVAKEIAAGAWIPFGSRNLTFNPVTDTALAVVDGVAIRFKHYDEAAIAVTRNALETMQYTGTIDLMHLDDDDADTLRFGVDGKQLLRESDSPVLRDLTLCALTCMREATAGRNGFDCCPRQNGYEGTFFFAYRHYYYLAQFTTESTLDGNGQAIQYLREIRLYNNLRPDSGTLLLQRVLGEVGADSAAAENKPLIAHSMHESSVIPTISGSLDSNDMECDPLWVVRQPGFIIDGQPATLSAYRAKLERQEAQALAQRNFVKHSIPISTSESIENWKSSATSKSKAENLAFATFKEWARTEANLTTLKDLPWNQLLSLRLDFLYRNFKDDISGNRDKMDRYEQAALNSVAKSYRSNSVDQMYDKLGKSGGSGAWSALLDIESIMNKDGSSLAKLEANPQTEKFHLWRVILWPHSTSNHLGLHRKIRDVLKIGIQNLQSWKKFIETHEKTQKIHCKVPLRIEEALSKEGIVLDDLELVDPQDKKTKTTIGRFDVELKKCLSEVEATSSQEFRADLMKIRAELFPGSPEYSN